MTGQPYPPVMATLFGKVSGARQPIPSVPLELQAGVGVERED